MITFRKFIFLILLFTLTVAAQFKITLPKTSGRASWYGKKEAGKKTANGERFNPEALTCASRLYPMNTILEVYYPKTKKSVRVRVNDRGPWVKGRVIDLSERAAEELGLKADGIGYVLITPQKESSV